MSVLGGAELVGLHQAGQVVDVDHRGTGGDGLRLQPLLGLVQVGHDARQLLALTRLPVALHQVPTGRGKEEEEEDGQG